jgi:hypothetical protein
LRTYFLRKGAAPNRRVTIAMADTNKPQQELLPPISESPKSVSGWLSWLVDPLPEQFLLPATGLLIVGLDWLLFSKEALTAGLALPVTMVAGFLAGTLGTYHLQRRFALNSKPVALAKALLAGVFVGVPFPLAGTIVGAWVIATSGLAGLKAKLMKERLFRR